MLGALAKIYRRSKQLIAPQRRLKNKKAPSFLGASNKQVGFS
jgi:hypothetical protein